MIAGGDKFLEFGYYFAVQRRIALFGNISNYIANLYVKNNIIPLEHKEVYRGGVELILNEAFTFILVIFLSAIFFKITLRIILLKVSESFRITIMLY